MPKVELYVTFNFDKHCPLVLKKIVSVMLPTNCSWEFLLPQLGIITFLILLF